MGYLDTSVLVGYYCPERRSTAVQRALAAVKQPTISDLVEVETLSALGIKIRTGQIDVAAAQAVVTRFRLHVSEGRFHHVPIGARQYALAAQWLGTFGTPLRALDGLHLAAAYTHDLTLVTADRSLATCAEQLKVACHLID